MLSHREEEVLSMLFGYSAKEIADALCISPETVRKTIANIKLKTGLQKATELVAWFFCRHYKQEYQSAQMIII